jgi:hypothetical protein
MFLASAVLGMSRPPWKLTTLAMLASLRAISLLAG